MFDSDSAFLFYSFQILYLLAPAIFIRRIVARTDKDTRAAQVEGWKYVGDGLKETFKSTGMMSTLLAAAAAALLAFHISTDHPVVQTLLLSSLACSIVSAKVSVELLSGLSFWTPEEFEGSWNDLGIKFVIIVCTPTAWISFAIYAFAAALLAMARYSDLDFRAITVTITVILGLSFFLNFFVNVLAKGVEDLLGREAFRLLVERRSD